MDYKLFEMYKMNSKERKTVITRGINNELMKTLNDKEAIKVFNDKIKFNDLFKEYLNRDYLALDESNYDEFENFIQKHADIIVKPVAESCGKGVEKIHVTKKNAKEVYDELIASKRYLVEEVAVQCKEISDIHPYSINTLRVVTIYGKVVVAFIRMGNNKNVVDNFNHDGLVAPIDIESGEVKFKAIDKKGTLYDTHPVTNKKIVGLKIPRWDEVKKLCAEASNVVDGVNYIAWDVCQGPDKSFLIEGNEFPGHDLYQLPPHRNGNIGLYSVFKKALEEKK